MFKATVSHATGKEVKLCTVNLPPRTTCVVALQKSCSLTQDVCRLGGCSRSSRRIWTHFTFDRNMDEGTHSLSCFGETELHTIKRNGEKNVLIACTVGCLVLFFLWEGDCVLFYMFKLKLKYTKHRYI